MWSRIDIKHIVSVPHHDGLLMDRVDDGLDEEIDGMAADCAIRMKEVIQAALDRSTREVKRLSESVRMVNDWQKCFEAVLMFGHGPTDDQSIDHQIDTTIILRLLLWKNYCFFP